MAIRGLLTLASELHFNSYLQTYQRLEKKYNILVIDDVHSVLLEMLGAHNLRFLPNCTLDELPTLLADTEILVMRSKLHFGKDWIDQAPELKCIARLGSGLDNIDEAYAQEKGITCLNAPEGNRNAVAEQTVGMLLSLLHNVYRSANQVRNGVWERKANEGLELSELTVGIIGFGNVGSQLAKLLSVFNCRILAYDKFKTGYGSENVIECSLEELQKEADVVSIHVPLNESSSAMINAEFISQMAKPFYLLNLARGGVVDTQAVVDAMSSNKIIACGLDVFINEKLQTLTKEEKEWFDFFTKNENTILTPHIGGLTRNSYYKLGTILAEKILKWTKKYTLVN